MKYRRANTHFPPANRLQSMGKLQKNLPGSAFTYPAFAANRQMPIIYNQLEKKRQQKEKSKQQQAKIRQRYQNTAKNFFGSSLRTDAENQQEIIQSATTNSNTLQEEPVIQGIPPFRGLFPGRRFPPAIQQPTQATANTGLTTTSAENATTTPDIIFSISLLLSSPPVPLITLTMPLTSEISASVTLPLNFYEENANIQAIFAVAYIFNPNLIIALAFPNDSYTHFEDPTVTVIFGLPINFMSGLSIPVAFGTEGPIYPVFTINPLATPQNPESGDVVVPPDVFFVDPTVL